MRLILYLKFLSIIVLINSCSINKESLQLELIKNITPPNGILISENIYCDQTEVSNFEWFCFMNWTEEKFGLESQEYLNTCPDKDVWKRADSCNLSMDQYYLTNPAYRDYPVIGISQNQANNFSKWRSDRVFEYMLIDAGIIKEDTSIIFTVQKFFTNQIERLNSDIEIIYYPEFRLPNIIERKNILKYTDSIDNNYSLKYKPKNIKLIRSDILNPCREFPTRICYNYKSAKKVLNLYNIRGNVSEWAYEENITYGGSWNNSYYEIIQSDIIEIEKQNIYTGFRNICEYKKWNE